MVAMSQQPMMMPTAELDTPMCSHSFVTVGITCVHAAMFAGRSGPCMGLEDSSSAMR